MPCTTQSVVLVLETVGNDEDDSKTATSFAVGSGCMFNALISHDHMWEVTEDIRMHM